MWDEAIYQNLKQSKHLRRVSYCYHCCDDDKFEDEDGIRESGVSMQLCPVLIKKIVWSPHRGHCPWHSRTVISSLATSGVEEG